MRYIFTHLKQKHDIKTLSDNKRMTKDSSSLYCERDETRQIKTI